MPEPDKVMQPPARRYDISRKLRRAQIVNVLAGVAVVVLACLGRIQEERKTAMYLAIAWCFVGAPLLIELAIRSYRKRKKQREDHSG